MMNKDEMARAVSQGLHQHREELKAERRRMAKKQAVVLFCCAVVGGLLILGSFGKLG